MPSNTWMNCVTPIFQRITDGNLAGVTSVITLMEVLVQPIQQGETQLAHDYSDLLLHHPSLSVVPIGTAIAERAAHLRAQYRLRTPDALQIAVALEARCQAFLTIATSGPGRSDYRNKLIIELLVSTPLVRNPGPCMVQSQQQPHADFSSIS